MEILTPSKVDIIILGIISKVLSANTDFLWVCARFSNNIQIFANFTRGMIGNETGHLVECVKLYGHSGVYLLDFFCSGNQFYLLLNPYLCFISLLYLDLYVLGDGALIS